MNVDIRRTRKLAAKVHQATLWAQVPASIEARRVVFSLPWPPTVNHYWRPVVIAGRAQLGLSSDGKAYRKAVGDEVLRQRVPRYTLTGRLGIVVMACPPDKRTRDLSNLWKGLEDSLKEAAVIRDDGDFDDERIWRGPIRTGGRLHVEIFELVGPTESFALPLPGAFA